MENLTELRIIGSPIKNLPFSIQNLNRLQNLELQNCGMVQLPSSIKECYSLRNLKLDDCVFIQEITVLPLKLETFSAKRCKSLKYMVITEECRSLRELILDDCIYLREIKGILQNLDHFSAKNCRLLTSKCASMLVNQVHVLIPILFNLIKTLSLIHDSMLIIMVFSQKKDRCCSVSGRFVNGVFWYTCKYSIAKHF
jgi:Leucine-rich repeat (LRR) protein